MFTFDREWKNNAKRVRPAASLGGPGEGRGIFKCHPRRGGGGQEETQKGFGEKTGKEV